MSKTIVKEFWISIIPDKMYNSWLRKGYFPKGAVRFTYSDKDKPGWEYLLQKDNQRKRASTYSMQKLKKEGWRTISRYYCVTSKCMKRMDKEIKKWYLKVFDYVIKFLEEKNYIKIKRGDFRTGFCAETNPKREVVTHWGAPLAKKGNKVIQVKEKFGRIVVYLDSLTSKERGEIIEFSLHIEKKFDCETSFN